MRDKPVNFLPKDTRKIVSNINVDNPYLYFHKKEQRLNYKSTYLEVSKRLIEKTENAAKTFDNYKQIKLKQTSRMVIGLGEESYYETSMRLHFIYGIPYIPASAIKGATRNWIISELFNDDETEALNDEVFRQIFGSPNKGKIKGSKGQVIFFDAYSTSLKITRDIMTPHYNSYYKNGSLTDTDDLLPIQFLTIEKGVFNFYIAINNTQKANSNKLDGESLLDITEEYLIDASRENGIGAKTALGYGRFEINT